MAVTRKRVITLAAGLALADASVVTLALPELLTQLDATVEGVAAVIGVYTVVLALALLPAERLRRRVGARQLGAGALLLFGVACAGCAAAGSLELLLALRAVQALGGAAALVAAFDLLGAGVAGSTGRRLWSGAAVIGFAAGPALGGVLTQLFDWRAIFVTQVPVALVAAVACAAPGGRDEPLEAEQPSGGDGPPPGRARPAIALALLSAALTAVLFLLVLLLVAGWNESPLAAAIAVSVLPLAALLTRGAGGDPRVRAAAGCALVAAGTLCLAFLPLASLWWTIVPQALAGAGMGLALPALAGELLPERNPNEAAWLLVARHAGIAVALLVLAPALASDLESATQRAKERGVALVLDSTLPPQEKLKVAPDLLGAVDESQPRQGLERAAAKTRKRYSGKELAEVDRLAERADDTLVTAVGESFRTAFAIAALLALAGGLAAAPAAAARRRALRRVAGAALAVPVAYALLHATVAPEPVKIADPCGERKLPGAGGVMGFLQDEGLERIDDLACKFGSSREEFVLGFADPDERRAYIRRYGVDPRAAGTIVSGLFGR